MLSKEVTLTSLFHFLDFGIRSIFVMFSACLYWTCVGVVTSLLGWLGYHMVLTAIILVRSGSLGIPEAVAICVRTHKLKQLGAPHRSLTGLIVSVVIGYVFTKTALLPCCRISSTILQYFILLIGSSKSLKASIPFSRETAATRSTFLHLIWSFLYLYCLRIVRKHGFR